MKNIKLKKLIATVALSCLSLGLMACGNSSANKKSSLDKIKNSKKIVLGTCADYPPYEFHKEINGKDTIVGFDIEIAKEVAKDLGAELEIKDMKFDGLLAALDAGNVDFVVAGMTPTPERQKNIDFSKIYYKANQSILVKTGNESKYKSVDDLKGLNIGAQKSSIQEQIAKKQIPGTVVKSLPKVTDLVLALNAGKVDAIVMEEPVAKSFSMNDKNLALTSLKVKDKDGGAAIAVKKDSAEFVKALNATIDRLEKANKIEQFVVDANKLSQ